MQYQNSDPFHDFKFMSNFIKFPSSLPSQPSCLQPGKRSSRWTKELHWPNCSKGSRVTSPVKPRSKRSTWATLWRNSCATPPQKKNGLSTEFWPARFWPMWVLILTRPIPKNKEQFEVNWVNWSHQPDRIGLQRQWQVIHQHRQVLQKRKKAQRDAD